MITQKELNKIEEKVKAYREELLKEIEANLTPEERIRRLEEENEKLTQKCNNLENELMQLRGRLTPTYYPHIPYPSRNVFTC